MNFKKQNIANRNVIATCAACAERSRSEHSRSSLLRCAAISSFLCLAACGDDSSSNSSDPSASSGTLDEDYTFTLEELEEMGVSIFDSADKLGDCTAENEFETVYVKADSSFYMCDEGKWSNDFSVEPEIVESKDKLGECNEENDGQMFRVPRDTIYDTYSCEDGEWVSDFGGSAEPVDPKTVVKGSFKDERNGKTYKTVKIGSQTWMAENLNYKVSGSYCYDGKAENCKKYGRLYRYDVVKKVCPDGWELPSKSAWKKLLTTSFPEFTGKALVEVPGMPEIPIYRGVKFESVIGLNDDPYGFNILPAGFAKDASHFLKGSEIAYFWTSTYPHAKYKNSDLLILTFSPEAGYLSPNPMASFAHSIRCIKK